ncbi:MULTISPECIES: helix-turn-helix domain-containing protein [unclassified Ensifer]|uniref:helix-turn-helix domain-containing protein n=1 Tax=unclassified Ensifer TaxID=2633371 RepID=UPI003F8EFD68
MSGFVRNTQVNRPPRAASPARCLSIPQELTPGEIKALRENNHVSQPVFARYLNTSESTVQKWETGAKRPSGPALKLLSIVRKRGIVGAAHVCT